MSQSCVQDESRDPPHSLGATEEDREIESDGFSELGVSVVGGVCQMLHTHREYRQHLQR